MDKDDKERLIRIDQNVIHLSTAFEKHEEKDDARELVVQSLVASRNRVIGMLLAASGISGIVGFCAKYILG